MTNEATALYAELGAADAAPTTALAAASEHVEGEGREVLPVWEQFQQQELPQLDKLLRSAHKPGINLDRRPDNMPEAGDED